MNLDAFFSADQLKEFHNMLHSSTSNKMDLDNPHDTSALRCMLETFGTSFSAKPKGKTERNQSEKHIKDLYAFMHLAELDEDENGDLIKTPINFYTCRTKRTLSGYLKNDAIFWWSFNGYYTGVETTKTRRTSAGDLKVYGGRRLETLRYIHAIAIDIDVKFDFWWQLKEYFDVAQLPFPTVVNETKNGYHCYWILKEKVKATTEHLKIYRYIMNNISIALNKELKIVDTNAMDPTRYLQVPRNIAYAKYDNKPSWQEMIDWLNIHGECNHSNYKQYYNNKKKNKIAGTSSLDVIIEKFHNEGAEVGNRNTTCFAMAAYYRKLNYSLKRTLNIMCDWNEKHGYHLASKPHRRSQVIATVNSVYKHEYEIPYKWITEITGYRITGYYKHAKDRADRERTHNKEYIKDIIYAMLDMEIGIIYGSQKELAEIFNIPLSTFKDIIKELKHGKYGRIIKICSEGTGRYARTSIQLNERVFKKFNQNKLETYIRYIFQEDDKKTEYESYMMAIMPSFINGRAGP